MRRSHQPALKGTAGTLLRAEAFEARLADWEALPARRAVRPLLSFLCSPEEILRWRAVRALGVVVARLAAEDLESARVVIRKLMWSLAEESGGFGWGAPEAMAEIMARHEGLAREFGHVLLSYVRDDGNRLDSDLLLRGAVWGLGRLARARPGLLPDCARHLEPFLGSGDAALRGLASWALSGIGWTPSPAQAEALRGDHAEFLLYAGGALVTRRVCDAATRAVDVWP
ncbi:MAG TPA: hypothetical protein VFR85_01595 [Anaeromyxobacteraceae bacterium]|nr:hypothetical protein [Anaeromyxobacteraceae bacterium]